MDLQECRKELDGIDRQLTELFERRMEICGQVAQTKIASGKAVYDGEREKQKLDAVEAMAHGEFNQTGVRELFSQIMTISRRYQYRLLAEHGRGVDLGFEKIPTLKMSVSSIREWRVLTATVLRFSFSGKMRMSTMWSVFRMQ